MPQTTFDFSTYIEDRTRNFTGRAWLFNEIDKWLANPDAPRHFIITGEPGIGKTAIAARLTQIHDLAAVHFCIARHVDTIDPLSFARSISHQLTSIDNFAKGILEEIGIHIEVHIDIQENYGQAIGLQIENLIGESKSTIAAFNRTVIMPIKKLYDGGFNKELVILVDALDEATQWSGSENIVDLIANAEGLPSQVRFILTSRPENIVLRHFEQKHIPHLVLNAGREENLHDIGEYICRQLETSEALQARLAEQKIQPQTFIDLIKVASQGNFLYLVWLLPAIEEGVQRFDTLEALPKGLDGIYSDFLTRTVGKNFDWWRTRYRPVLGVLAASQVPLKAEQLAQFVEMNEQDMDDCLMDLQQFLEPVLYRQDQYKPYHQSMTDFLFDKERAGNYYINPVSIHKQIVSFYQNKAVSWEEAHRRQTNDNRCHDGWSTLPDDSYLYQYIIYHLSKAGLNQEIRNLLSSFDWLKSKLNVTNVYSLIPDYDYISNDPDLDLIKSAIRLSAHILYRDKTQLRSQLYGRLMDSKSPTVQNLISALREMENESCLYPLTSSLASPEDSLVEIIEDIYSVPYYVNAFAITPDGRIAVLVLRETDSTDDDSQKNVDSILVWDLKHMKILKKIDAIQAEINLIALKPDGKKAIIAIDNFLEICNLEDGNRIFLGNHDSKVKALSVSTDGKRAISASDDSTLKSWNLEELKEIKSWIVPIISDLNNIAIDADYTFGLSVSYSNSAFTFDINNSEKEPEIIKEINELNEYDAVALATDAHRAFVGVRNSIRILDLNSKKEIGSLEGHPEFISNIATSPNGNFVLSSIKGPSSIYFYNLEKNVDYKPKGHFEWITALSISSDEKYVISGAFDRNMKVWDLKTGRELYSRAENDSYGTTFDALVVSPDNKHFFSAQKLDRLKYWDLKEGKEIACLDYDEKLDHTYDAAFTFNGKQIISVHYENVNIWEIQDIKKDVYSKNLPIGPSSKFVISPAGFFISVTPENRINVWNINKGWKLTTLEGHNEPITSIALSPDGLRLISGSADKSCKVWDIESGKKLAAFDDHKEEVYAITISTNGFNVASISTDNIINIWKIENGIEKGVEIGHSKVDIKEKIESFHINNDATRAILFVQNAVKVWDLRKNIAIANFSGDSIFAKYCLSPANNVIVVGEVSGRLHFLKFESLTESLISFGNYSNQQFTA